jgi:hypothetical protein
MQLSYCSTPLLAYSDDTTLQHAAAVSLQVLSAQTLHRLYCEYMLSLSALTAKLWLLHTHRSSAVAASSAQRAVSHIGQASSSPVHAYRALQQHIPCAQRTVVPLGTRQWCHSAKARAVALCRARIAHTSSRVVHVAASQARQRLNRACRAVVTSCALCAAVAEPSGHKGS